MVDDSLVYMRGFGAAPTDIGSPDPSLRISPQVFLADGRLVSSRSYPLGAALPEDGTAGPAGAAPGRCPGQYLIRRAFWASFFPDRTIVAETGSTVRLRVHNRLTTAARAAHRRCRRHRARSRPGATTELSFAAPCRGHLRLPRPRGRVRRADPRSARRARRGRARRPVAARARAQPSSSGSGSGCARTWTRCGAARARAGQVIDPARHRRCRGTSCSTTAAGSGPWRCPATRQRTWPPTRRPCRPAPPARSTSATSACSEPGHRSAPGS